MASKQLTISGVYPPLPSLSLSGSKTSIMVTCSHIPLLTLTLALCPVRIPTPSCVPGSTCPPCTHGCWMSGPTLIWSCCPYFKFLCQLQHHRLQSPGGRYPWQSIAVKAIWKWKTMMGWRRHSRHTNFIEHSIIPQSVLKWMSSIIFLLSIIVQRTGLCWFCWNSGRLYKCQCQHVPEILCKRLEWTSWADVDTYPAPVASTQAWHE